MNEAKIARFSALVEQAPTDELARFTLSRALFEAGRLGEARQHFEATLALKPDWMMAHILLGRCLVELDDLDAARNALRRARDLAVQQGHGDPLAEIDELLEEIGA